MDNYSDIIDLPHVEPQNRQRMSMQARAAQFAPFAALTGHHLNEETASSALTTESQCPL